MTHFQGLEELMTDLEDGDSKKAMFVLRVPPMKEKRHNQDHINTLLVTLGMESSFIIISILVTALIIQYGDLEIDYAAVINLFRQVLEIFEKSVIFGESKFFGKS